MRRQKTNQQTKQAAFSFCGDKCLQLQENRLWVLTTQVAFPAACLVRVWKNAAKTEESFSRCKVHFVAAEVFRVFSGCKIKIVAAKWTPAAENVWLPEAANVHFVATNISQLQRWNCGRTVSGTRLHVSLMRQRLQYWILHIGLILPGHFTCPHSVTNHELSVQFSPLTDRVVWGTRGMTQQRSSTTTAMINNK